MRGINTGAVAVMFGMLAACGAQSPQACTQCLMVASTYALSALPTTVNCNDSSTLDFPGWVANVTVYQQGSSLKLSIRGMTLEEQPNPDGSSSIQPVDVPMVGEMHTDGSVSFGPAAISIISDDGTVIGNGEYRLEGFFVPSSDGLFDFQGTIISISTKDGCEDDAPTTWTHGGDRAHASSRDTNGRRTVVEVRR